MENNIYCLSNPYFLRADAAFEYWARSNINQSIVFRWMGSDDMVTFTAEDLKDGVLHTKSLGEC